MPQDYQTFVDRLLHPLMDNPKAFVSEASQLLGVTESTIYNKLRGRNKFSLEDVLKLSERYGLSVDEHLYKDSKRQAPLPFFADGLKYSPRTYDDYFNNLLMHFRLIKNINPVWRATYIAGDLPIFYFLHFPHLLYMKLYVWNLTTWKIPHKQDYNPMEVLENKPLIKACDELLVLFQNFPAQEIWTQQLLQRTILQYNYLVKMDFIHDAYAKQKIKSEFKALIELLQVMAVEGKRLKDGQYMNTTVEVFLNPLVASTDLISLHHEKQSRLYVMHDTPNFILTKNPAMTAYIDNWVKHLIHYSTKISSSGAIHQSSFFGMLKKQLKELA